MASLIIGATPGLTVNMAVALAVPLTMHMPLEPSLVLLLALYCSGIFGGSVSAILINAPGTPASAATVLDGYPLAQQGKAGKALKMALAASLAGGLFSVLVLVLISRTVADFALLFGPAERAALLLFALTLVGLLSGHSILKGLIAGSLGLLLSTVGLDPMLAVPRFTFGLLELEDGLSLIPVLVGLFAISEVLLQAETRMRGAIGLDLRQTHDKMLNRLSWGEISASARTIVRSSLIGTFIGILPGIGATVASFVGYGEAKRSSRQPQLFGKGSLEGVAASEAANNAVTGATLIPLLALSIPGDSVTAILYGALLIQGVTPGPLLFQTGLGLVYEIYVALIAANLFMAGVGLAFLPLFRHVTRAPARVLFPIVFVLSVVGAWSVRNNAFDLYVMMGFGALGYVLRRVEVPLAPLLIAFILGVPFEQALRQALVSSDGSPAVFLSRPLSAALIVVTVASLAWMAWRNRKESTA
ncbi:MAG: hypothetical protein GEU99_19150 [Luteitalea sp.]|nr:hypothetical protein [Luteitalea sp.]